MRSKDNSFEASHGDVSIEFGTDTREAKPLCSCSTKAKKT